MPNRPILAAAALALATAVCLPLAAAETPYIGYRGDGSGVFPEDCKPVTEWQEYAGMRPIVVDRRRGKETKELRPDPESEALMENIVWKTPLPNMSESSPVVVGKRVFTLCEPGWPVDTGDAPVLVCLDADSGEILWQQPVDQFDAIPDPARSEAKDLRRRYWETMRAVRDAQSRGNRAIATKDQAAMDAVIADLEQINARGLKDLINNFKKGKQQGLFAGQDPWGGAFPGGDKLLHHSRSTYNFVVPTWSPSTLGATYATPCSDGKLVYASTAYGCTAAFTMDGERQWVAWLFTPESDRHPDGHKFGGGGANSPQLADGGKVLVHRSNGWVYGVDTATGGIIWAHQLQDRQTQKSPSGAGEVGTGVVLTVGESDVYVNARGRTFRCRDGKLVADRLHEAMTGMAHHGILADHEQNIVYFGSGGHSGLKEYGENTYAVKVMADGPDKVTGELVWQKSDGELGGYMDDGTGVLYRGKLYLRSGPIVDAATGSKVGEIPRDFNSCQGLVIADGRLWGGPVHQEVQVDIAVIESDGSVGKVTHNWLDHMGPFDEDQQAKMYAYGANSKGKWYGWTTSRGYPFFSGSQIFFRTFDYLYCIGDQAKPFVPSKAFELRQ